MNMKLLPLAAMMALAAPAGGAVALASGSSEGTPILYSNKSYRARPGKGKGRRPHHSSRRFVAMDKREARKRRNRA